VPRKDYRVGVPKSEQWQEIFNSDASVYGGSAVACTAIIQAESKSAHNQPFSVTLNLPPLAGVFLKWKQNT
jgi:1,4-alpha-glucan branching enzyme